MRLPHRYAGGHPRWLRRPGSDRLLAMWATLYPSPAVIDVVRATTPPRPGMVRDTEYLVLPAAGGSRMLVPPDRRVGAAMALARSRLVTAVPQRALWAGLALGLRTGLVHLLFPARLVVDVAASVPRGELATLSTALASLFGVPVILAINVGRARANRKPVVQVLDSAGRTLGFCKVGWNEMTRALLASEAATLTELERTPLRNLEVPRVLFLHQDGGLDHLVVSSLHGGGTLVANRKARTRRAMAELAGTGIRTRTPLVASPWWQTVRTRAAALAASTPPPNVGPLLPTIEERCATGGVEVAFGRWHGDWSPWNMTFGRGSVLVWDWERSEPSVPVGFDALHFELQSRLRSEPMLRALDHTREHAAPLLSGFPDQPAPPALVLQLYLAALHLRYAEDAIAIGDPAVAAAASDILAFLASMVADGSA